MHLYYTYSLNLFIIYVRLLVSQLICITSTITYKRSEAVSNYMQNIYVPTLKSLENGEKKTKSQILYSKIMSLVRRMTDRLTDQMNYKLHAH